MINLAQEIKICNGIVASTGHNGGTNSEAIDLANAHMVYIVVHLDQTVDGAAITPQRNDAEDTAWIVLANNVKIWENNDLGASDTLVRLADDTDRTTTNDVGEKLVVMQVDPSSLGNHTGGDNLPCNSLRVNVNTDQAGDGVSVLFYVVPRYKQPTVPEMRI